MNQNSNTNRSQEISAALQPAYANASKLKITKVENKALIKEFPKDVIEIMPKDGAIYIPHIFLSKRLNQVFGPGSWSLICREHYIDEDARAIYAEHILIIRGCFVGEAVGDKPFDGDRSQKENYGNIIEFLAAQSLRRICGKRLSCGAELWEPDYAAQWRKKYGEQFASESWDYEAREMRPAMLWKKKGSEVAIDPLSESPIQKPKKIKADDNLRHVMVQTLQTLGANYVLNFAVENGILKNGQGLEDWPLDRVAVSESEIKMLQRQIEEHIKKNAVTVKTNWRNVKITVGNFKDKMLGEIEKEVIADYWAAMPELSKNAALAKKHEKFINALNEAAGEFNFQELKTKKSTKQ